VKSNSTPYAVKEAEWDYFYEGYIKWCDLLLTSVLPITILLYLTVRIIASLRKPKSTDILLRKLTAEKHLPSVSNEAVNLPRQTRAKESNRSIK